jgi:hypothetical protein
MADSVVPILDVRDLVAAYAAEFITATYPVNALANTSSGIVVPTSEQWLVLEHTVTATTTAAENLRGRPSIHVPAVTNHVLVGGESTSSLTDAVAAGTLCSSQIGPVVVPAGSFFAIWVHRITTAGNINVTSRVRFVRMRR